ncbi:MAG TPA: ABC transporter permease subunit [Trichocoleus sp.]|jgi:phosphonate transport system permease protein
MSRPLSISKTPYIWAIVTLGAIVLSLYSTGIFRQEIFNLGGLPQFWQFFRASVQPNLSAEFLQLTWNASLTTLAFAVCGTFLSVLFGFIGGVLISEVGWLAVFPRQTQFFWIRSTLRSLLAVPRSIHEMIWGLFFVNLFGLDPLVGIVAIVVPYSAIVAKVFSELLDETPRQPLNALLSSGTPPLTALLYSLLPQAFLDLLSYSFYRFECSLRSAAVLGIIGAGGLGYQIMLSLQSLQYEQLWTLFYALVILNGCVDLLSASLRHRLGSPSRLDLNFRKRSTNPNRHPSRATSPSSNSFFQFFWQHSLTLAGLSAIVLIPFCFWVVGADYSKLWSARTFLLLSEITRSTFPPNFQLSQISQLLMLSLETVAMSILAIVLAGLGGILLSFPAAHNFFLPGGLLKPRQSGWGDRFSAWAWLLLTRLVLLVFRAIPAPIWALVSLFIVFPGILPGAIALGLHNLGILGRLMAEVNENLDQRPLAALKAQGTPAPSLFLYGILPLTLTRFIAYVLYRWEVCTRETVIVGLVGAGGLGLLLTEQLSSFDYSRVVVTLGCFVLITFGVDWASSAARRSLR